MSTKTNTNIPFNEYKQGFKQWKESIKTSQLEMNLGHHHSLLALDGTQYNKDKEDFSDRIWNIHHNRTSIALLNEKTTSSMVNINCNIITKRYRDPKFID